MHRLNIIELYGRGLTDFSSLPPLERDVFVVHDLNLYYEMKGSFEDYVVGDGHGEQLAWLVDTLLRVNDQESHDVIRSLLALSGEQRELMRSLSSRFYELMETRWLAVELYLHQQGIAIDWQSTAT